MKRRLLMPAGKRLKGSLSAAWTACTAWPTTGIGWRRPSGWRTGNGCTNGAAITRERERSPGKSRKWAEKCREKIIDLWDHLSWLEVKERGWLQLSLLFVQDRGSVSPDPLIIRNIYWHCPAGCPLGPARTRGTSDMMKLQNSDPEGMLFPRELLWPLLWRQPIRSIVITMMAIPCSGMVQNSSFGCSRIYISV